ncbi:MAG: ribose transport system permease protein [Thermomicrobiales bacterium]|nr:ribose transport system permease protein [Thermomicrobiales bacterium]MEA2529202.1 ribose transport system permease protein [Thermomicrobiales bacterium]MEA2593891.1 ribose transport system permease protein [Thermomicrobiales bacterium]
MSRLEGAGHRAGDGEVADGSVDARVRVPSGGTPDRLGSSTERLLSFVRQNRSQVIPYVLIGLLLVVAAVRTPSFVTPGSLRQQLVLASYLAIIAGGQTLVILSGGIDLSVAWNLNFSAILMTQTAAGSHEAGRVTWAVSLALLAAAAVGFVNGLGVAYLRIPSLVMTLGMNAVLAGLTLVYTNGSPQGLAPPFAKSLAVGRLAGQVPYALVFWLAFTVALIFLLRRTVFGRRLYAVGNNPQAAYLSGVPVRRVLVAAYTLCGLCAGLAGILLTGYSTQSYLGMGDRYVLQAIAAVVIGGTSILGGSGGYGGTVAGAITVVLLDNVLQIIGIERAGQNILYGFIILVMLFVYGRSARVRE